MLARGVLYQDPGEHYFHRRQAEHAGRYKNRLVRQLERLGHKVTLEPLLEAAHAGLGGHFLVRPIAPGGFEPPTSRL
jgi:hypothetical protein